MEEKPTKDQIEAYIKRAGKHGMATLSTLGKHQPFVECLNSELGLALLGDLVNRHETLLNRLCELNATDEEKVEFKVIKRLLIELSSRLLEYDKRIKEIKGQKTR